MNRALGSSWYLANLPTSSVGPASEGSRPLVCEHLLARENFFRSLAPGRQHFSRPGENINVTARPCRGWSPPLLTPPFQTPAMNQLTITSRPQIRTPWQRTIQHRCGLVLACCLSAAFGQANEFVPGRKPLGIRTRDIVRKRLPPTAKSIALEYTIEAVDSKGRRAAVDPAEHCFTIGDAFLVRVKPQDDVYVYVFTEGPTGDRSMLLPDPAATDRHVLVRAGQEVVLPGDGSLFEFVPPAGAETLVVVAVKEPCDSPDKLQLASFQGSPASRSATVLQVVDRPTNHDTTLDAVRHRQARSFRSRGPVTRQVEAISRDFDRSKSFTAIEPPTAAEPSTYALGVTGQQPELVLDIPLRSREPGGKTLH